jgi:ribosomal protein S27E
MDCRGIGEPSFFTRPRTTGPRFPNSLFIRQWCRRCENDRSLYARDQLRERCGGPAEDLEPRADTRASKAEATEQGSERKA